VEPTLPPSREGSVVLDIGDGIGALLLRTSPELVGVEPELTRLDGEGGHVHTEVRERRVGGDVSYAALYPALAAGHYRVDDTGQVLEVVGGAVTDAEWAGHTDPTAPAHEHARP
jgi:hypothetical protein